MQPVLFCTRSRCSLDNRLIVYVFSVYIPAEHASAILGLLAPWLVHQQASRLCLGIQGQGTLAGSPSSPLRSLSVPLHLLFLFRFDARLGLLVLLVEFVSSDEKTDQESSKSKAYIDDPHGAERVRKCFPCNGLLFGRQGLDQANTGASGATSERRSGFGTKTRHELRLLRLHLVVEDNRADDDGDGGAEIAREAKSGGCGCDVAFLKNGLVRVAKIRNPWVAECGFAGPSKPTAECKMRIA